MKEISCCLFLGEEVDIIKAFNSTSIYLDDLLNIGSDCFDDMVNQINPSEPQLNWPN